mmetsp:Transcript_44499/g.100593  ORF Transcript_44499/g.100593 Transcript_44499/m.100593 type:complete len:597 (+) Transcript_44499:21-1811(+)
MRRPASAPVHRGPPPQPIFSRHRPRPATPTLSVRRATGQSPARGEPAPLRIREQAQVVWAAAEHAERVGDKQAAERHLCLLVRDAREAGEQGALVVAQTFLRLAILRSCRGKHDQAFEYADAARGALAELAGMKAGEEPPQELLAQWCVAVAIASDEARLCGMPEAEWRSQLAAAHAAAVAWLGPAHPVVSSLAGKLAAASPPPAPARRQRPASAPPVPTAQPRGLLPPVRTGRPKSAGPVPQPLRRSGSQESATSRGRRQFVTGEERVRNLMKRLAKHGFDNVAMAKQGNVGVTVRHDILDRLQRKAQGDGIAVTMWQNAFRKVASVNRVVKAAQKRKVRRNRRVDYFGEFVKEVEQGPLSTLRWGVHSDFESFHQAGGRNLHCRHLLHHASLREQPQEILTENKVVFSRAGLRARRRKEFEEARRIAMRDAKPSSPTSAGIHPRILKQRQEEAIRAARRTTRKSTRGDVNKLHEQLKVSIQGMGKTCGVTKSTAAAYAPDLRDLLCDTPVSTESSSEESVVDTSMKDTFSTLLRRQSVAIGMEQPVKRGSGSGLAQGPLPGVSSRGIPARPSAGGIVRTLTERPGRRALRSCRE